MKAFCGTTEELEFEVWDANIGKDVLLGRALLHAADMHLEDGGRGFEITLPLKDTSSV